MVQDFVHQQSINSTSEIATLGCIKPIIHSKPINVTMVDFVKHQPIHVKKAGLEQISGIVYKVKILVVFHKMFGFSSGTFIPFFLFTRLFLPTKKNTGMLGFPFGMF